MIHIILILSILILISAYLIHKSEYYFVVFIILLRVALGITLFKITPEIGYLSHRLINILLVLYFLYLIFRYKINILTNKYYFNYISLILMFFIYITILALFRDIYPTVYWHFFRNFFFNFVVILCFLTVRNSKRTINLLPILFAILLVESVIGLLQYVSPTMSEYFTVAEYIRHGEVQLRISQKMHHMKLVVGSLGSMACFGTFVINLWLFFFGLWIYKKYKPSNITYAIVLTLCFIPGLLAASRVSLVSLLVGVFLLVWFINRKMAIIIGVLPFILANVLNPILIPIARKVLSAPAESYSSIQRLSGILVLFDKKIASEAGYLSLQRSIDLFNEMFVNPLFGQWGVFLGGFYDSSTDAFLMLLTIEFGLVGVILLLLPYFYTLKLVRKFAGMNSYRIMLSIFIVLLLQTVVNEGLFYIVNNLMFFALSGIVIMQSAHPSKVKELDGVYVGG